MEFPNPTGRIETQRTDIVLPARWYPLRPHEKQILFFNSTARFNVVPAGRRSGKTEIGKRRLVIKALSQVDKKTLRYVAAAPTHPQAKAIYWQDLKDMVPQSCIAGKPNETELAITLKNGAIIKVVGMDQPQRIEGPPLAHFLGDEYANMKAEAWLANVRPALSDTFGTADLIGVPEGRNHYFETYQKALVDTTGNWKTFTWWSESVLAAEEIEAAKNDMDPLTYRQEMQAEFVTFSGVVYYTWTDANIIDAYEYDRTKPIFVCFDFNIEPGTATVLQERHNKTFVFREVHLAKNGYTTNVAKMLVEFLSQHEGMVYVYGDATGGARKTSQTQGSDWELIRQILRPILNERLKFRVPSSNPAVKDRINAVNTRICNVNGERRLFVTRNCKHTILDFEGVLSDGVGGIDKDNDKKLTHLTDGIGYFVQAKYPVKSQKALQTQI